MALQHFNKESFDKSLNEGKLMMGGLLGQLVRSLPHAGPVIEQLAEQYGDKAVIGRWMWMTRPSWPCATA